MLSGLTFSNKPSSSLNHRKGALRRNDSKFHLKIETYTDQEMTAELCPLPACVGKLHWTLVKLFSSMLLLRNFSQTNHFYYPRKQSNTQAESESSTAVTRDDKVR